MSKKKLAVITARADDRVQKDIVCGIAEAAFAADCDVVVFSNIYNHWKGDKLLTFENIIYNFFEPDGFDGVIITGEAFSELSVISQATDKIRKSGIPAVVINGEIDGFKSLYCDDEHDMEKICEHLIKVHNITDIDILTGQEENIFSHRRISGCKKVLERHGIPFKENKVYYGDFWYDSGYYLAQRYINGELPLPQAIICANDCMAYQLCDTLTSAGIRIPDDVTVTGYDCTGGRIYHHPVLTTYRSGRREIGIEAVNYLLSTEYEIKDEDRFMTGNTCFCGIDSSELNNEINLENLEHPGTFVSNFIQFSTEQFSQKLTLSKTLLEYLKTINRYFFFHEANSMFFCLDKGWNGEEYAGNDYLCCEMNGSEDLAEPLTVSKRKLISSVTGTRENPSVYYFCPLCFQTRLYGYIVLAYENPERFRYQIRSWNQIVSNSLEFLRLKNDIHYLMLCQRTSSFYDTLTGFCKLQEFRRLSAEATGRLIALKLDFSTDKKYVYDTNRRNDIISATAQTIKQVCTNNEVCCRTENDVFLVLCQGQRESIPEKLRVIFHRNVYVKYCDNPPVIAFAECEECDIDYVLKLAEENADKSVDYYRYNRESIQHKALLELKKDIVSCPQKAADIDSASRRLCISKGYFRAIYRKCFGISYVQDCINEKIMFAKYLLCTTVMSVYAVALQCGYGDERYFARQFHQIAGCSPVQYRKQYCNTSDIV